MTDTLERQSTTRSRWSWVAPSLGCAVGLSAALAFAAWWGRRQGIDPFEEAGFIESMQVACWALSAVLAFVGLCVHRRHRDVLNFLWLMMLSVAAALREIDAHEMLNPRDGHQKLGADAPLNPYGVSFKLSWWLDGEVHPLLKAAWGAGILLCAAVLVAPPLIVRAPIVRLLRRGDAPTYLFLAAIGFLGFAYAADDLFGRGQFLDQSLTVAMEESAELLGSIAFLASLALTLRRPLSVRAGAD